MSKIYTSADQLIGHTPLLELGRYGNYFLYSKAMGR